MILTRLVLHNFRNYADLDLTLPATPVALVGENGVGKTNLLEAVYTLCVTRSFRVGNSRQLVRFDQSTVSITGYWHSDRIGDVTTRWLWQGGRREFFYNGKRVESAIRFFGRVPVVALTPGDAPLAAGPPQQRRTFVDMLLSQQFPAYLELLSNYRRVLLNRTRLLQQQRSGNRTSPAEFEPWDEQLVRFGRELIRRREQFVSRFAPRFRELVNQMTGGMEVDFTYRPDKREEDWADALAAGWTRDLELGYTAAGPHRDDFRLLLDGRDLRRHGSQGQHKLVLLGLKLTEAQLLQEQSGEEPLLLLDDLFGELDAGKIAAVSAIIPTGVQSLVTSTHPTHFDRFFPGRLALFEVTPGMVQQR
ncbi:MAG: DNA replication/repair protein RecF [Candidatus Delongbacteria bacterium]|nr:DNA replication/repair protein RecF [bacterium]MBL7032608.1 DNA replication/repair protein RecF [Candidatus Delongbacteria bacterium]